MPTWLKLSLLLMSMTVVGFGVWAHLRIVELEAVPRAEYEFLNRTLTAVEAMVEKEREENAGLKTVLAELTQ